MTTLVLPRARGLWPTLARDPMMLCGLALLLALVALAMLAPWITWHDPAALAPRLRLKPISEGYWLGTDSLGRDLFSRVLYGGRLSITLAALVAVISVCAGLALGILAGYFRRLDGFIMRIIDGIMAIPGLLLAIAMVALGGASIPTMVIAISIPEIPRVARLVRSVVLSVREEPYVEASLGMGTRTVRVLWRHVLPSTINPLVVQATFICASAILIEAVLGFLGLGFPPEIPSLGSIISEGRAFFQRAPWIVLFPGAYLALLILSINLFGDALRDRLDPRMARKRNG
ncbi:Glutathione transport system permease protein GsiD [Achromobacter deleyi]|uniref:Glutathione transport system permease protein GsiD n=1 Tax=Achromobacter deleyi TaxID=1353891 RepID=A0A6S7A1K2_9BURK|nr:ABC transporter permease [Achromobacter deleyi]CAB3707878.1 Glutathione transport system permease protein GsiD [Achromobacter deleyi]CAB3836669.1 Glutathione transport system permease protein GsiD [Achromobacter deleyi]CAB3865983.1 Glutathione transport system permease protein GsiD [Achromobacter deleyi]CAB3878290.1 Glutathione transport system permease protein GsiD [Achromobacter deleyi]